MADLHEVEAKFKEALEARGIMAPASLNADGKIHRLPTHDKPKARNGRYLLHLDERPSGWFDNLADGQGSQTWRFEGAALSRDDLDALNAKIAADKGKREAERKAAADAAAAGAAATWEGASTDCAGHPYLTRKGVKAYGLRRDADRLFVPVRDVTGTLRGLQTIFADKLADGGDKRFGKGVSVTGCYHSIGRPHADNVIAICEGYATGATVHEATGWPVVVAFDCGNLLPVTKALRAKYPDTRLLICCDDDYKQKSKNPGKVKGEEAAGQCRGTAVLPVWPDGYAERGSDFNDLAATHGVGVVRDQLRRGLDGWSADDVPAEEVAEAPPGDDGMWAPAPYVCSHKGVARIVEGVPRPFCAVPLWVAGVRIDAVDQSQAMVVRWHRPNGSGYELRQRTVSRSLLLNARKIVDLQASGFPVDTNTASAVVEYLHASETAYLQRHERADDEFVSRVTGWHGADDWQAPAFLFGSDRIGPNCPHFESDNSQVTRWVRKYSTSGTLAQHTATLQRIIDHSPDLATVIAVALGSPLLRIVGQPVFVLDICGTTSRGKTKAVHVAASVYGSPDAKLSWDLTPFFLEININAVRGLSVCLDESQRAKPEQVQKTIDDVTTREGRGRGQKDGGVRDTSVYESLVISTGEQSIADFGDAAGARARILTMWGPPWGRGMAHERFSEAIAAFQRDVIDKLHDHHGHVGRIFAGYLAGLTTEERRGLRARYRALCNAVSADVELQSPGHPVGSRLAEYGAFIRLVGELAENVLGLHARSGWVTPERWADMITRGRGADAATGAMQRLVEWALMRSTQLHDHPDHDKVSRDVIGVWYPSATGKPRLAIVVSAANDMMKAAGFQIGAVASAWSELRWVEGGSGSKVSKVVSLSGGKVRAYVLTDAALAKFVWQDASTATKGAQVPDPPPDDADLW